HGLVYGAAPDVLPTPTPHPLRQFLAGHSTPSYAPTYLYGDLAVAEALEFLHQRLGQSCGAKRAALPPLQPPFDRPRVVACELPPANSAKGVVARGWVLPPPADPLEALEQTFFAEFLLGSTGSPLRRAQVESKNGEALAAEGFFQDTRQPFLAVG